VNRGEFAQFGLVQVTMVRAEGSWWQPGIAGRANRWYSGFVSIFGFGWVDP
jgi:hypothetical protein